MGRPKHRRNGTLNRRKSVFKKGHAWLGGGEGGEEGEEANSDTDTGGTDRDESLETGHADMPLP